MQINSSDFKSNNTHSILTYKPDDDDDFGLIYCRAFNPLGEMEEPCVFKIIPAGEFETLSFSIQAIHAVFDAKSPSLMNPIIPLCIRHPTHSVLAFANRAIFVGALFPGKFGAFQNMTSNETSPRR